MKQFYKKWFYPLITIFLLTAYTPLYSQNAIRVSGTVKDATGETLPGVNIKLKGTNKVVISDINGKYSLEVPNEQSVLVFNYIGFLTQERTVGRNTNITVVLSVESKNLDEVVVVGYGEVARRDLTGAVGSVKMNDLQKAPVRSFEEALAGRLAGVNVTSSDGQPGSDINIVIRGNNSVTQDNSPLYVIDGFPIENPNNNAIDPNDIESIEVLKDASATAIYGARGANGVILITTKRGKEGKTVISYKGYYGTQEVIQRMKVLEPYDFVKYQILRNPTTAPQIYTGPATVSNGWSSDRTVEYYKDMKGVDWQSLLFQQSPMANHSLSISGGTAATKYSVSGSLLKQEGVIINSGYSRAQGKFTLDQDINNNLKLGITTNYSALKADGTIPSELSGSDNRTSLLNSAWGYRPVTQGNIEDLEELDTDELLDPTSADGLFNPVTSALNQYRVRKSSVLSTNAYADYKFWKNFKLRVTAGFTQQTNRNEVFNNSKTRSGSPNTVSGRINGVNGSIDILDRNSYLNENTLTYTKKINKNHKIDVLGGFTVQGTKNVATGVSATLIPNESLGLSGMDEGTPSFMTSSESENTLASFLGRINYNFKSKYLFTASFRADGSSKFAPENRWGYFPSGSFAWQLGNEPFMKKIKAISEAKIRTSYGVTGNNRVSDFASQSKLSLQAISATVTPYYPFANTLANGVWPSELGNTSLKWETTEQMDLGLDLGFFNNRVSIEADAYRKVTRDLLLNAQLPPSMGYGSAYKNIGKVLNKGLEFTLNTVNVDNKTFNWNTNFNISFNRNEILGLAENQSSLLTNINWDNQSSPKWRDIPAYIAKIGQPIAQFYGYIWKGNYQLSDFNQNTPGVYTLKNTEAVPATYTPKPGYIKYEDINGDMIIDSRDYTVIGNPNPDFIGGLSNNFRYKGFDLNVFFQFSYGGEVLNANRLQFEGGNGTANQNQFATVNNAWTLENQNNTMFIVGGQGPRVYSSRVVEDGSFIRLKTIALGYNLPNKYLEKMKLKSFRLYVSAQNLHTWTKYTGLDPEVSGRNSALTPAFDYSVYPRAKTITFGLNVSL
ncbi:MAG: SusC/RagA family TonB-linked outer membrane protein [Chitinophagaceae bacterium]